MDVGMIASRSITGLTLGSSVLQWCRKQVSNSRVRRTLMRTFERGQHLVAIPAIGTVEFEQCRELAKRGKIIETYRGFMLPMGEADAYMDEPAWYGYGSTY